MNTLFLCLMFGLTIEMVALIVIAVLLNRDLKKLHEVLRKGMS
ncbi:MAG: hypothetical protein AAF394_17595 [Planctomycetota bacterium]